MANSKGENLLSGEKTVSAAGTAEALAAEDFVQAITIIAKASNTGQVYIGASDVDSSTNDGLDAGEVIAFDVIGSMNLAGIFLDVGVSGEGVDFYATYG